MASDLPGGGGDHAAPDPVDGSDHAARTSGTLDRGLALVRFLRANCPWDARQTHETLVPHLLEESHEVAEAVHTGDDRALEGELGDLLLNLAFQIVVGEERGALTADSVTRRIEEKMRRRHPHLYGLGPKESWESIKAREREEASGAEEGSEDAVAGVLSGVPASLDTLSRAFRIQDRVAGVGFDWDDWRGALEKVVEEVEEVREELEDAASSHGAARENPQNSTPREGGGFRGPENVPGEAPSESAGPTPNAPAEALEEELGDLLFAVVNLVRLAGSHPVRALDRANRKFTRRFEALEAVARERGVAWGEATLDELDELWDEVKRRER